MFASLTDIQAWLANDKVIVNDANSQKPNIEAMRIVKSQLSGVFSVTTLASWADPNTTPSLIRSIAGRLTAAYIYRERYSEETGEIPAYAQELYNEAISMLGDIKQGNIVVLDDSDNPLDAEGGLVLGFWPNDSAPVFTMAQEFS
jgi:hypothetical protein